jgi:hypothetical protein
MRRGCTSTESKLNGIEALKWSLVSLRISECHYWRGIRHWIRHCKWLGCFTMQISLPDTEVTVGDPSTLACKHQYRANINTMQTSLPCKHHYHAKRLSFFSEQYDWQRGIRMKYSILRLSRSHCQRSIRSFRWLWDFYHANNDTTRAYSVLQRINWLALRYRDEV